MPRTRDQSWPHNPDDLWIITPAGHTRAETAIPNLKDIATHVPVKEYRISDFARYLVGPEPIEFEKRLVGCEVHYHQPADRRKIWQILPQKLQRLRNQAPADTELFVPHSDLRIPHMQDGNLEAHLNRLYALLKSNDPIYRGLAGLDRSRISDIIGICEDLAGSRTWLKLRGSIDDKIEYVGTHIFQNVGVVLERAYMQEGVFELRAFDFTRFDTAASHRMLKFFTDGRARACVLDNDPKVAFWLEDVGMINDLHMLEQALGMNRSFKEAFGRFRKGHSDPLKLLFKHDLSIDYSRCDLPSVYRQAIGKASMAEQDRQALLGSLNLRQYGISVHYLPRSESNPEKLCTHLSVMHDIRALHGIKQKLPKLYASMEGMARTSEAGSYYLLDTITGYQNVE